MSTDVDQFQPDAHGCAQWHLLPVRQGKDVVVETFDMLSKDVGSGPIIKPVFGKYGYTIRRQRLRIDERPGPNDDIGPVTQALLIAKPKRISRCPFGEAVP